MTSPEEGDAYREALPDQLKCPCEVTLDGLPRPGSARGRLDASGEVSIHHTVESKLLSNDTKITTAGDITDGVVTSLTFDVLSLAVTSLMSVV